MLEVNYAPPPATERIPAAQLYDWRWMAKTLARKWWLLIVVPAICVALAAGYVVLRTGHYTASTVLNITNLRLSSTGQDTFYAEAQFDPTFLETQIQIIGSDPVATAVIQALGLTDSDLAGTSESLRMFRRGLGIQRIGQSNLVLISYTATDPNQAAAIADEVAKAYMAKLHADREAAVQTASSWLRERLRGLGTQAQIVSSATVPVYKSDMRGILIIAAAGLAGMAGGVGIALVLGFLDRGIRDTLQAQAATGVETLGVVPVLETGDGLQPPASSRFDAENAPSILSAVEAAPFSPLWQALRQASIAGHAPGSRKRPHMVAVTSTADGEGKTTMAANLALLAAGGGKRVLLVDAQPYDPALSRMLAPKATLGLASLVEDGAGSLSPHVVRVSRKGVDFLPFGTARSTARIAQQLWSPRMEHLLDQMGEYDLVVFDMPPLVASGDLRAAGGCVDGVVLVIEWAKTSADELKAALSLAGPLHERLIGTIINKANPNRLERMLTPEAAIMARQSTLRSSPRQPA